MSDCTVLIISKLKSFHANVCMSSDFISEPVKRYKMVSALSFITVGSF